MVKRLALVAGLLLALAGSARGETHNFPSVPAVYPLVNRVAFTNVSVSNGTYTILASPTLTLGTSNGVTGAWDVRVTFQPANNGSTSAYLCIIGTNAGSNGAGSQTSPNALVCLGSPANALAGGLSINQSTFPFIAEYSATYANGATVAFTCRMDGQTSGVTSSGYCTEEAWPI